jgi:hypothetical protein
MSDAEEHHPLIAGRAYELDEYLVGNLSVMHNDPDLRQPRGL